jgi:hypothetical protein
MSNERQTALCVNGPASGQVVELDRRQRWYEVPDYYRTLHPRDFAFLEPDTMVSRFTYRRELVCGGGEELLFLVPVTWPKDRNAICARIMAWMYRRAARP